MSVDRKKKWRFRLRSILLLVNLFVLLVPLGSIYVFRLYENELVRETESELIAQGAYIAAMYKQALVPLVKDHVRYGMALTNPAASVDEKYTIINPVLDLSHSDVLPPRPDATLSTTPVDALARKAGKLIQPMLEEASLTTLAGVRVLDYQGVVVAGGDDIGESFAPIEEVAGALSGHYTAILRQHISKHPEPPLSSISRGAGIRVFVAMPVVDHGRIVGAVLLSRSPRNIMKGLYDERERVILAGGTVLCIAIALALLTSYAISRPLNALMAQTQRIARGEKDVPAIDVPVTQELAELSQHISAMAQTIAERSEYIRNFATHVSHEFKTPLTAIQGAVELIQEHGTTMPPAQLSKFLSNVTQDTDRLKILVSRLMELARADMLEARPENTAFAHLVGVLRGYYQDWGIMLITHDMDAAVLPMPEDIARTILGNLIENSAQHAATQVTIRAQHRDGKLTLTILDNGSGISPANARRLFTPFFTTKREKGGTGLGLMVVRSLLAAYKATITCIPQPTGAVFEVLFD